MIDNLRDLARSLSWLKMPVILFGLACLFAFIYIVITSKSHTGDTWLIPSILGVLWATITFALLSTFSHVPPVPNQRYGFFSRLKIRLARAWYWIVGLLFVVTTLGVLGTTYRMVSIWVSDYGSN